MLTIALGLLTSPLLAQESCLPCHKSLRQTAALEHTVADWENSAHGKAATSCSACHGGQPAAAQKGRAHGSMLPASDPKSPLYFTNIPQTCGKCHGAELEAFKSSLHFKELARSGRGPNCVTCHGSMANRIISARDMEQTCRLCHRRPTQAYAARLAVDEARAALRRLEAEIAAVKAGGKEDAATAGKVHSALTKRARALLVQWHSFDAADVFLLARGIAGEASSAYVELRGEGVKP